MTIEHLLDTLGKAEISISEAARILPVTRATLHNWKSGTTHGESLRLSIVAKYVVLLDEAIKQGYLPLKEDASIKERPQLIKNVLNKVRTSS